MSVRSHSRTRAVGIAVVAVTVAALALGTGSGRAASPEASCVGILTSFVATTDEPGRVADLVHTFHAGAKAAGLPPGLATSASLAKFHLGDPLTCFS
jgi:hypothetical protein